MTSDANLLDDEIDIRELIYTVFRYKWVILGITLVVMLVVLLYTKFGSPKIYAAQAQVLFTKPLFIPNLDSSIQNTPQTPEASVVKDLALDDSLLTSVYTSTVVSAALGEKVDFTQFKANMSAKLTGTTKLYLVVLASDPKTAAIIVNVWADKFITQINALYSVNKNSETQLIKAADEAYVIWDTTEQSLLQKMPEVDARKIELTNKESTLAAYLNTSSQQDLIMKDAQSLLLNLATISPDSSKLGIEYQISLINLYQRATGGLAGSQLQGVQIQIAAPSVDNARTVAEAKASLEALINSLTDQQGKLQVGEEQIRKAIIDATVALESANFQLTQLTSKRDLAVDAYNALSTQMKATGISGEDVIAKPVGQALPPENPVSNRTLLKTIIAGALAFVLSCFGVLFIQWWKSPAPAQPSSEGKN